MKKQKFLIVLIIILLTSGNLGYANAVHPGIVLNGNHIIYDNNSGYPYIDEYSRMQVPLRASMEAIGCNVEWNELTYSVSISKDNTLVNIPIGEHYIVRNGTNIPIDTCAQIINGRTYLPIRAVYESFGAYVSWNDEINCVEVSTLSPLMRVIFIDVGQGDSALVDFGSYEVLIDAGDTKSGAVVVDTIKPFVDGKLELVIATHPDSDHIGGMVDVFNAYTVERVIDSGYISSTDVYNSYAEAKVKEGCFYSEDCAETIALGNEAYLDIIELGDLWNNSNDMSVVTELVYGNTRVLFTGDISSKVEKDALSMCKDIDVLKVAHHGSSTSTSQDFLSATKPEHAIVSAGKNNKYGHPKIDTLERLIYSGVKVHGTFKSGTITLNLNNNNYNFNKAEYLTFDDVGANIISHNESVNDNIALKMYIGNLKTKKFHISSCTYASKIKSENEIKFVSSGDAKDSGYIPCSKCDP